MWPSAAYHRPITVITTIKKNRIAALDLVLTRIGKNSKGQWINFTKIRDLHFAAWLIVANDDKFPASLVMEATYDGDEEAYFGDLIENGGTGIDAIYVECEGYPGQGSKDVSAVKDYLRKHLVSRKIRGSRNSRRLEHSGAVRCWSPLVRPSKAWRRCGKAPLLSLPQATSSALQL